MNTPITWIPVTDADQLQPGTVVRDRTHTEIVQVIAEQGERLIRFDDYTLTTVHAAQRYLEFAA